MSGNVRITQTVDEIVAEFPELAGELSTLPGEQPKRDNKGKKFRRKHGHMLNGDPYEETQPTGDAPPDPSTYLGGS